MPVTSLEPNTHLKIRFRCPRSGKISFVVEAEFAVNCYILDEDGLKDYYAGKDFSSYGGYKHRRYHSGDNLDLGPGWWYLIIENDSDYPKPVPIHYELDAD